MSTTARPDGIVAVRPARTTVRLLAAAGLLFAFFALAAAPSPLLIVLQQRWHLSTSQVTLAFAAYTLSILITLLSTGTLSLFIGRRTVLTIALIAQLIVCVMFIAASGATTVILARILQGLATGLASGTLTATVIDSAPPASRLSGPLIAGSAPMAGLAAGALLAALAERLLAAPITIVFSTSAVVFAVGLALTPLIAASQPRRSGALRSLVPHLTLAPMASAEFAAGVPMAIATWAFGGLYLGLAPTLVHHFFGVNGAFDGGLVIAALCAAGMSIPIVLRHLAPDVLATLACSTLLVGAVVGWVAFEVRSLPLFGLVTVMCGGGFGAGFASFLRLLTPLSTDENRTGLMSSMYLVNYLAFGVPVLIAGAVIQSFGTAATTTSYCALVAAAAAAGMSVRVHRMVTARSRTA